jgi:hypothetical protein
MVGTLTQRCDQLETQLKNAHVAPHGGAKQQNPILKAMHMLEEGNTPVDIMDSLELDVPAMQKIPADYTALEMHRKKKRYVNLLLMLLKYFWRTIPQRV